MPHGRNLTGIFLAQAGPSGVILFNQQPSSAGVIRRLVGQAMRRSLGPFLQILPLALTVG
jgi:hypothetical protein